MIELVFNSLAKKLTVNPVNSQQVYRLLWLCSHQFSIAERNTGPFIKVLTYLLPLGDVCLVGCECSQRLLVWAPSTPIAPLCMSWNTCIIKLFNGCSLICPYAMSPKVCWYEVQTNIKIYLMVLHDVQLKIRRAVFTIYSRFGQNKNGLVSFSCLVRT